MTNPIELFSNQASDTTSASFEPTFADSKGFQDNPTYIEFFGGLGGGTLAIEKLGGDESTWFPLTGDNVDINATFPDIWSLDSINNGTYRVTLTGATSAALYCYVYNAKLLD